MDLPPRRAACPDAGAVSSHYLDHYPTARSGCSLDLIAEDPMAHDELSFLRGSLSGAALGSLLALAGCSRDWDAYDPRLGTTGSSVSSSSTGAGGSASSSSSLVSASSSSSGGAGAGGGGGGGAGGGTSA